MTSRARRGFNSHPQLQNSSSVPQISISLKGTNTNPKRIDIYGIDKILEQALIRLQTSTNITEEDKTKIKQFVDHLFIKEIGKLRVVKYINHLIVLSRLANDLESKPLVAFERKSIEKIVCAINTSKWEDSTKHDYKSAIKKYFQWLRECDEESNEFPEEVKWIKIRYKEKRKLPEELLTGEELKRLTAVAENLRDIAIVLVDFETGGRIGEVLSCLIKHVTFDKHGAVLMLDGKTGPRRVMIIAAAPALAQWLSVHPLRNDPNAPLWVGIGTVGRYEALSYNSVRAMLARLRKKAGITKRVYTHLMRHSRATELASFLTEAQMDEHLGWVQGSKRSATYVHLSGRNVDGALLASYGIVPDKEEKTELALKLIKCPRCGRDSGNNAQYCPGCGILLDQKTALLFEEERANADQIMDRLMQDEEVRNLLAKKISQIYSLSSPHPSSSAIP